MTAAKPSRTREALDVLKAAGVRLDSGLSDDEVVGVESRYGFAFADDHRELLAAALPVGDPWVDWRRDDPSDIARRLAWPLSSALFDVRNNAFWPRSWGERPTRRDDAVALARQHLSTWPRLVPVYGHRYLPAAPAPAGSPVFSVYQTDVIYYGNDLVDYLRHELGVSGVSRAADRTVRIALWSDLAEGLGAEDF